MPKSMFSPGYEHFRELLVQARKDAGLTQNEVASLLKRPQSYVSKYENGERRLDLIEFLELTHILHLDAVTVIRDLQDYLARQPDTSNE
jgi:transcriptional regulator with XRE-family HTH domain